jgi:competence protein ComEA
MSKFNYLLLATTLSVTSSLAMAAEPVDINSADAATLAENVKGVGETKAEAIVAFREKHGPFKTVEDLALVDGIGEKTVQANRELLTVGAAKSATPAKASPAKEAPPKTK